MVARTVLVESSEGIATVVLHRPEARNALDLRMREELEAALAGLRDDAGVRVLILRGAGGHFSAGGDVKTMAARRLTQTEGEARVRLMNRAILALARFPRPTLAMVDGFAVGAGCNLALACDLVIASERARLGQVFARIGLIPDGGGTYFLPRRVGLARAKALAFTGEVIEAREAERIGLVDRVVPPEALEAETRSLARRIAEGPPLALALTKELFHRAWSLDLAAALELEALGQGRMIASEDHREGLAAFFEKRPPRFQGR